MNYSVHAIMYGYFFLTSIKAWPKWLPAHLITIAQISQMIVGTTICVMSYIYLKDDQPCAVEWENVVAGGLMYGSYLYLFAEVSKPSFVDGAIGYLPARGSHDSCNLLIDGQPHGVLNLLFLSLFFLQFFVKRFIFGSGAPAKKAKAL